MEIICLWMYLQYMTFAVPEEEDCEYKVWEEGGHVHNIPRGSDTLVIIYIY